MKTRRTKGALSGVVASMLLVAPALAAPAAAAEHPVPVEQRKSHQARANRQHTAQASPRPRRAQAAAHLPTRMAPPRTAAFFDDGGISSTHPRPGGFVQTGMASWYGGNRWHGKRTSSGAIYDQNALTAAHATLPIGTRVRVTMAGTGRDVVVTINDRPGTRARVIDLSRAAAHRLGMLDRGVAVVTLSEL